MALNKLPLNCVAFDCGNSSLRTVVGQYDGEKVTTTVVSQIPNAAIEVNGLFYWDILYIFDGLKKGLKEAAAQFGTIDSIGICTWGVDFGLVDEHGYLLANPLSYRNTIGEEELSKLTPAERLWMFEKTGIQNNRINSLYQLSGIKRLMPALLKIAGKFLMIPDLLSYLFTGEVGTEFSIASCTQMLDVRTGAYATEVLDRFGISPALLPALKQHGQVIGYLKADIAAEANIAACPVICVPSHDTACAVTSVPTQEEEFLFISSGTWSLIGTELKKPVISREVYDRDFANEGGAFNTITLLKNSTGMHILQCIKKELEADNKKLTWDEIVGLARSYSGKVRLFDPNSYEVFNPKSMLDAIRQLIHEPDGSVAQVIASAYASLAYSYRYAVEQIQEITRNIYSSIYIVGGGSQNGYLNQLTADVTGKTVVAGPKEATSLGNIGVQLIYHDPSYDLKKVRALVLTSEQICTYEPRTHLQESETEQNFKGYKQLVGG